MPLSPRAERVGRRGLAARPLPDHRYKDKQERGTVLVVGGSPSTPGAVMLAAVAALRAGAGRLQVVTSPANVTAVGTAVPEALVAAFDSPSPSGLADHAAGADAVVVGPGVLEPAHATQLLAAVLAVVRPEAVVVIDAAAIEALGATSVSAVGGRLVLTPNLDELDALAKSVRPAAATARDGDQPTAELAVLAARAFDAAVVCFECVAAPSGELWIDQEAVAGLGTSGSGDVLAGIAGGVGARCGDATTTAIWAAAVHRAAGRRLAARIAPGGYLARELADAVAPTLADLEREVLGAGTREP